MAASDVGSRMLFRLLAQRSINWIKATPWTPARGSHRRPRPGMQRLPRAQRPAHRPRLAPRAVRFVHDATTDSELAGLFAACRSGQVAVLVGSTGKWASAGAGPSRVARLP